MVSVKYLQAGRPFHHLLKEKRGRSCVQGSCGVLFCVLRVGLCKIPFTISPFRFWLCVACVFLGTHQETRRSVLGGAGFSFPRPKLDFLNTSIYMIMIVARWKKREETLGQKDVRVFAVGSGRQENQPSLPPSVRPICIYMVCLVGAAFWVSGAAAPWFKVWCCVTAFFPPAHPELWNS